MLNLCANNYLGLASHPEIVAAAHEALDRWGFGMASVRFICGTQALHRELERRLSEFLGTRGHDPLLLLLRRQRRPVRGAARRGGRRHLGRAQPRLDHRRHPALQGAAAAVRATATWTSWRRGCEEASGARYRLIATDGVFSMDGYMRQADGDLRPGRAARRAGDGGRLARGRVRRAGRPRHPRAARRDRAASTSLTGTLGKAMGGASGGYVAARREIVELLRQRSRPYLFSNSIAPPDRRRPR